jgi:hypothetical protein
MIHRLGVSIHAHELRAVLVRGSDFLWHASLERDSSVSISEALASLLSSLPKTVGIRRATIAIGPSACQVKQIDGLPAVDDLAMLTRLLHENSAAFFLRRTHRLAVSDVERFDDGSLWAAAFDLDLVTAAIESLKKKGFSRSRIVPSVLALASVLPAGTSQWSDGDHTVEISTDERHVLLRTRRVLTADGDARPSLAGMITKLGADAWDSAAAFGAALLPRSARFAWRPAPDPKRVARVQRARLVATIGVCAASALAAVAAPGVRAAQIVRSTSGEMNRLRASQTEYARAQGELRRASLTLDRVERFQEDRGKTTLLLGAISQVLPESTALVTLRLDTLEGNFVALTPHAADILPQLTSVTEIVAPRIVGSLTKEVVGTVQVERATVRFKRPAPRVVSEKNAKAGKAE